MFSFKSPLELLGYYSLYHQVNKFTLKREHRVKLYTNLFNHSVRSLLDRLRVLETGSAVEGWRGQWAKQE